MVEGWRCFWRLPPMLCFVLFVVWFCFVSCLLPRPVSGVVCPASPPVGSSAWADLVFGPVSPAPVPPAPWVPVPLPPSVVSGCCLCRGRSGVPLSGGALSARLGRLRRLGVLL